MDDTPSVDTVVQAVGQQLSDIDPGCVLGGVVVMCEVIRSDSRKDYAFFRNGAERSTETMLTSVLLQMIASESRSLPEEDD